MHWKKSFTWNILFIEAYHWNSNALRTFSDDFIFIFDRTPRGVRTEYFLYYFTFMCLFSFVLKSKACSRNVKIRHVLVFPGKKKFQTRQVIFSTLFFYTLCAVQNDGDPFSFGGRFCVGEVRKKQAKSNSTRPTSQVHLQTFNYSVWVLLK